MGTKKGQKRKTARRAFEGRSTKAVRKVKKRDKRVREGNIKDLFKLGSRQDYPKWMQLDARAGAKRLKRTRKGRKK